MIPASARHSTPWQQFAFWFGANVNVLNAFLTAYWLPRSG
jgi:hypothetical protein